MFLSEIQLVMQAGRGGVLDVFSVDISGMLALRMGDNLCDL